jgi:hypothetical protein
MSRPRITINAYRFLRVKAGGTSQVQVFFQIEDEKRTQERWLGWFQKFPGNKEERDFDLGLTSSKDKVEVIGVDTSKKGGHPISFHSTNRSVTLNEVIPAGVGGNLSIFRDDQTNFFASLNPNGTHDYFKLRFVGFVPNDLVGNRLIGKIVTVAPAHKHTGKKPSFIPH